MAVFADGNRQRLGINRAAGSLGLRLPDDVSVVGFGDLPFVDWVNPRLTTVRTPLADMTVRAACTVPLLLSGQQPETAQAEVTIELVVLGQQRAPAGDGASRRTQSGGEGRLSRGRARAPGARSGRRVGHGGSDMALIDCSTRHGGLGVRVPVSPVRW